MPEDLYHPEYVHLALARIDGINDMDVLEAAIRASHGPDELPPEVFVRLLRRYRVDRNSRLERVVAEALLKRVKRWVNRNYSGLLQEDREEVVQELLTTVVKAVASTTGMDWWEIRFFFNLKNAAADLYESLFDKALKTAKVDISDQAEELHDKGLQAKALVENWVLEVRLAEILDPDELTLVHPIFLSGIPISGNKGKHNLVTLLRTPEGTLREKKTLITNKLKAALKKDPLA